MKPIISPEIVAQQRKQKNKIQL